MVTVPITVEPLRNWTWAMDPPVSLAVALSAMVAGAVNVAPEAGLVRLTVGRAATALPPLPLQVMLVGTASLLVQVPCQPKVVLPPAAMVPL